MMFKFPTRETALKYMGEVHLIQTFIYAFINSLLSVVFSISFALLLFQGKPEAYLPYAVTIFVFGIAINTILIGLGSTFQGTLTEINEVGMALFLPMVTSLTAMMGEYATPEELFHAILLMMTLTCLLSGILFFLIGYFKAGIIIRFIPYAVFGGFLNGSACLLLLGGVSLVTGMENVHSLDVFSLDNLLLLFPWLVFGGIITFLMHRFEDYRILPGSILAGILGFYAFIYLAGIEDPASKGLLLEGMVSGGMGSLPGYDFLFQADWGKVLQLWPQLLAVPFVCSVALLLNCTGIENSVSRDLDLDKEMLVAGTGSILASLVMSLPAFHVVSSTAISHRLKSTNRFTALISGALLLVFLYAGASLMYIIPKGVLGGIVFFIAFEFIYHWMIVAWRELPLEEYLIVLIITVFILTSGMIIGISAGLILSVGLFVIKYSRISSIRRELNGTARRSYISRSDHQKNFLKKNGELLYIQELHGFIFFGTTQQIVKRILNRLSDPQKPKPRKIILDFRLVAKIDMSVTAMFSKIMRHAEQAGFRLVLTNMSEKIRKQILAALPPDLPHVSFFNDLNEALIDYEDELLNENGILHEPTLFRDCLMEIIEDKERVSQVISCFEDSRFKTGEYLIRQGEGNRGLYFIETGSVCATLNLPDGKEMILGKLLSGSVIGEISLYVKTPRTANVYALEDTHAYFLSVEKLTEMEKDDPVAANTLHRVIGNEMGIRLINTNETVRALT